jgi:hypothetical protein
MADLPLLRKGFLLRLRYPYPPAGGGETKDLLSVAGIMSRVIDNLDPWICDLESGI